MAESSVTIQHEVDPATGNLITTVTETICATPVYKDLPQVYKDCHKAAMFNVPREKDKLVIKVGGKEKVVVNTMRLSCQSDTYQKGHRYGGVVIYLYNGKSDWRTANNTHCLSGYIIIQDTDSKNVKQWRSEPGQVHGAIYRNAFGESVNNAKVVGEGFAFREKFEMISGVFNNPSGSEFHDSRKRMNEASVHCLRKIVMDYWKYGGSSYIGHTFKIKDLLEDFKD